MKFRRTLFGASLLVVQPLLLNLLSLPATAYIIAVLGPSDYGQWGIALALTMTSGALTNLGTRSYFVRRVAQDPTHAQEAFAEHLGVRSVLSLTAGATAAIACVLLGYPSTVVQCTAILALSTFFTATTTSVSDLLQASERLPAMASINFVAGLLLTAASVAVMFLGWGPVALAWAYVLGPALSALCSLVVVQRTLFPVRVCLNTGRYLAVLKDCRFMGLQQIVYTIGAQAENLLVPKMVSITEYGYFAAGTLLAKRMEVVPDALSTAFYPIMVKQYRQGSPEALKTVKKFVTLAFGLCVPAAIVGFVLAHPIAQILFSENPALCAVVIQITVWTVPLLAVAYALGYSLNAAGYEVAEARIVTVASILAGAASVVLVWRFGVIGACLSLVTKPAIGVILRLPLFLRTVSPEWRRTHPQEGTYQEPAESSSVIG